MVVLFFFHFRSFLVPDLPVTAMLFGTKKSDLMATYKPPGTRTGRSPAAPNIHGTCDGESRRSGTGDATVVIRFGESYGSDKKKKKF